MYNYLLDNFRIEIITLVDLYRTGKCALAMAPRTLFRRRSFKFLYK